MQCLPDLAEPKQATKHNIWCRFPGAGREKSISHPFYCDKMSDRNRKTGHYDQSKLTEELHNTLMIEYLYSTWNKKLNFRQHFLVLFGCFLF